MRVLLVSHSSGLAGAERSLLNVARQLKAAGHQVLVTVPRAGALQGLLAADGIASVKQWTPWWMGERRGTSVRLVRAIRAVVAVPAWVILLLRLRPSLVWTNSAVIPSPAIAAKFLRMPHIWAVRESLLTNPSLNGVLSRVRTVRMIAAMSSLIVCVSEYVRGQFEGVSPSARSMVSSPRVDESEWVAVPREVRADLRVLFAGTFGSDKGLEDVITSVAHARQSTNVKLTVAGGGRKVDERRLLLHAARLGVDVRWLGWVSEPDRMYLDSDVVVVASRNEAYGRVTAEALVRGIPVVGYAMGGTSEILGDGGGVLVDPTPESLAQAFVQLGHDRDRLAHLAAEAREAGRLLTSANTGAPDLAQVVGQVAIGGARR